MYNPFFEFYNPMFILYFLTIFQFILLLLSFFSYKKIFFIPFFIIISIILIIQSVSLYLIGEYVPVLAISNFNQGSNLGSSINSPLIAVIFIFIVSIFIFHKLDKKISIKKYFLFLLIISLFIKNTPVNSFFSTLKKFYKEQSSFLSKDEADDLYKKLNKTIVYKSSNIEKYLDVDKGNNIIVIFIEGFSADIISKEITPNLYEFSNNSLTIKNYFNHTAATFRGLRGQLTSSYQMLGGYYSNNSGLGQLTEKEISQKFYKSKITPITKILKENNYHSYFQASNSKRSQLSLMLSTLNFNEIYGLEEIDSKLIDKDLNELTDKQSFQLLSQKINNVEKPFFYGVYTVGTHVGLDSTDLKYGNGKNPYLNKFHNMDYWFGEFIKDFNAKEISQNTIIIVTSDHSTYPEPEFKKTFNIDANYFVDKIPLIIYKKGISPNSIDVDGLNSLSLTPTILNILGIQNSPNIFLGSSIFDNSYKHQYNCITAIGDEYYKTCKNSINLLHNEKTIRIISKLQSLGDNKISKY
ncbi:sulfatase-like hydrolase/transferase [Acinetobacter baumannii]|jgi:membrane-anchored protein YejM (alkaline phosphatase superfamily)|uniref:sulfatase-like hydrolase/transferase n=1 Tax=Acinetobacter baumannii TaxID=470 RepID=UPI003891B3B2